jgi:hypothetical protein
VQWFLISIGIAFVLNNPISLWIISGFGATLRISFLHDVKSTDIALSNLAMWLSIICFIFFVFLAFRDAYSKCFVGVSNNRISNAIWEKTGEMYDYISKEEDRKLERMQREEYMREWQRKEEERKKIRDNRAQGLPDDFDRDYFN